MKDWAVFIFGLVAGMVVTQFLPSYFKKKGENLATKEDVQQLTEITERVKTQHQLLLEQTKPFTAEETLKRTAFFNAKFEAYNAALQIIYRKFAANSLQLQGASSALGPASDDAPSEAEMNLAYGRMAMFASGTTVLQRYQRFLSQVSGPEHIGDVVAAMREDLGLPTGGVSNDTFGYIVGVERPRPVPAMPALEGGAG